MLQKCWNNVNLPAALPLDATEGTEIVYPVPTILSRWYSSMLGMLLQMWKYPIFTPDIWYHWAG